MAEEPTQLNTDGENDNENEDRDVTNDNIGGDEPEVIPPEDHVSPDAPGSPAADVPASPPPDDSVSPAGDAPVSPTPDAPVSPPRDSPASPPQDAPTSPQPDVPVSPAPDAPVSPTPATPQSPSDKPASPTQDLPTSPQEVAPTSPQDIPSSPKDAPSPPPDAPISPKDSMEEYKELSKSISPKLGDATSPKHGSGVSLQRSNVSQESAKSVKSATADSGPKDAQQSTTHVNVPVEDNSVTNARSHESVGSRRSGSPQQTGSHHSGSPQEAGSRHSGSPQEAGSRHSGSPQQAGSRHSGSPQQAGSRHSGSSQEAGSRHSGSQAGSRHSGSPQPAEAQDADITKSIDGSREPSSPRLGKSPDLSGKGSNEYSQALSEIPPIVSSTALNMVWSFGWNRSLPVLNLTSDERTCVLYTCAHVAVIYDYMNNSQTLLQGHAHSISCMCLSADKKWLATADDSEDCMIIVWDTYTAIPVQTFFEPACNGIVAMAMSLNARYLATLSGGPIQTMGIWDWTISDNKPLCSADLCDQYGEQREILFNPENEHDIVSNSESQVLFYYWEPDHIEYFAPPLSDHDFHKPVGRFSQSVFHQGCNRALTATSIGNLVVWSNNTLASVEGSEVANKKALKIIKVMDTPIRVLTVCDEFIVIGLANGVVKFYDQDLMLMNWYSDFNFGPVNSISFEKRASYTGKAESGTKYPFDATIERPPFVVRNFVLSTTDSVIAHITTNGSMAKVIHREHNAEIHALATHPSQPLVAVGSYASLLKIWDYEKKEETFSRVFDSSVKLSCCAYNTDGSVLAVGTGDGRVYLLDSVTLSLTMDEPFHYARDTITHIKFCPQSQFLATADAEYTMSLFKRKSAKSYSPYIYLARYRAHYKPICDVMFGVHLDTGEPRLLSLGQDRLLVEYDLENSCVGEIKISSTDRIEQSAVPLCMAWYPPITKEHFILTNNDQYKYKMYNATTKMCRKTLLGPTYGSPVLKMTLVPGDENREKFYMAFVTKDKVGLNKMPLDGNPHNGMSVMAHSGGVTNLACGYDGRYLFTAGGADESLHMWYINLPALEAQANLGGEDLIPFYGLLDGGREGEMFSDMEDYFYYALIRSQGVNASTMRETSITIPLYQVSNVMRAMGFYPTEQEIENMINEIKFSDYVHTGRFIDEVDLRTFIKLYINHRPAFGLSLNELFDAFERLGTQTDYGTIIERADLLEILQSKGEHMTVFELAEYLTTLLGYNAEGGVSEGHKYDPTYAGNIIEEHMPYQVTCDMFSQEVLGFPISKHI